MNCAYDRFKRVLFGLCVFGPLILIALNSYTNVLFCSFAHFQSLRFIFSMISCFGASFACFIYSILFFLCFTFDNEQKRDNAQRDVFSGTIAKTLQQMKYGLFNERHLLSSDRKLSRTRCTKNHLAGFCHAFAHFSRVFFFALGVFKLIKP